MSIVSFMSQVSTSSGATTAQQTQVSRTSPEGSVSAAQRDGTQSQEERDIRRQPQGARLTVSDSGAEALRQSREGTVVPMEAESRRGTDERERSKNPEEFTTESAKADKRPELTSAGSQQAEDVKGKPELEPERKPGTPEDNAGRGAAVNAANREDKPQQKLTSLAGYTSQQIELMYRQGKIDYADYEKAVESRKAIREEQQGSEKDLQRMMRDAFVRTDNLSRMDAEERISSMQKDDRRMQENFFLQQASVVM